MGRAEEKLPVANQIDRSQDHQRRKNKEAQPCQPGNRLSYPKLCMTVAVHSPPFPLPQWDVLTGDTNRRGEKHFLLDSLAPIGGEATGVK